MSDQSRQRSLAALRAETRPRTLQGEPRLCRVDEQAIADAARRTEDQAARAQLIGTLSAMRADLELLRSQLGRVVPGDHRGWLREIDHGLKGLERLVSR